MIYADHADFKTPMHRLSKINRPPESLKFALNDKKYMKSIHHF